MIARLKNLDSHHRLIVALVIGVMTFLATQSRFALPPRVILSWDAACVTVLLLAWVRIVTADPARSRVTAKLQDSSRTVIFGSVIVAACASLFALAFLLGAAKDMSKGRLTEHVALALVTVVCSWCLVHTVFTLRYAHLFYSAGEEPSDRREGLDFPDEKNPDYTDFAYFSFIVGMTCQVSDVQITSREIRRLALLHGLISFVFNTVVLALSINIISGLL